MMSCFKRRGNEGSEQRMGLDGAGFELGMELDAEGRMLRVLDSHDLADTMFSEAFDFIRMDMGNFADNVINVRNMHWE